VTGAKLSEGRQSSGAFTIAAVTLSLISVILVDSGSCEAALDPLLAAWVVVVAGVVLGAVAVAIVEAVGVAAVAVVEVLVVSRAAKGVVAVVVVVSSGVDVIIGVCVSVDDLAFVTI